MSNNNRPRVTQTRNVGGFFSSLGGNTLLTRLLIAAVIGLLIYLFPLQWFRSPSISVKANRTVFAPSSTVANPSSCAPRCVVVTYELSEPATVEASVLNAQNQVVRRLSISTPKQNEGAHWLVWDGLADGGAVVPDGAYNVQVVANGSANKAAGSVAVTIDTLPPPLQLANLPQNEAKPVKTNQLTVEGVSEAGATVWLDDASDRVTADTNGGFRLSRQLVHGDNTFKVSAMDSAGNIATAERTVSLLDRPPAVKIEQPAAGTWTKQAMVQVKGQVDTTSKVKVNGSETTPDAEGNFAAQVVLNEGKNTIRVEATDAVGNVGVAEQSVQVKTRPPVVQVDSLAEGVVVRDPQVQVYGKTEPGVKLAVNEQPVIVDSSGTFAAPITLAAGRNTLTIRAEDLAGNVATLERTVSFEAGSGVSVFPIAAPVVALVVGGLLLLWVLFGGWLGSVSLKLWADRPGMAGANDKLYISYALSRAANVTLRIVDEQGFTIATPLRNVRRDGGEHSIVWDGRGANARAVPVGRYTVQAQAKTLTSSAAASLNIDVGYGSITSVGQRDVDLSRVRSAE